MSNQKHHWVAGFTISGITLPPDRELKLVGGLVTPNAALAVVQSGDTLASNLIPTGQKGPYLEAISRWILVLEFDSEESLDSARVREYAEKVILPLRLASPGRILLDAMSVKRGNLEDMRGSGLKQPAREPPGSHFMVELTDSHCDLFPQALPQLTFEPRYDIALTHFSLAHYEMDASEAGNEMGKVP